MKKRYDEELAKSAFAKFLNTRPEQYKITWETVPQEFEPPDYYVNIEGMRYAVEVTAIIDQIEINGRAYSSLDISSSLRKFIDELEAMVKNKNMLRGGYAVGLSPLSNFPDRRGELLMKLLKYIERTQYMVKAEEEVIIKSGYEYVGIQKIDDKESYVGEIISYTPKYKSESLDELSTSLNSTLEDKAKKLSKINVPIILLILDSFNYLRGKDWHNIIRQLNSTLAFHTICRISSKGETAVLKSSEKSWIQC